MSLSSPLRGISGVINRGIRLYLAPPLAGRRYISSCIVHTGEPGGRDRDRRGRAVPVPARRRLPAAVTKPRHRLAEPFVERRARREIEGLPGTGYIGERVPYVPRPRRFVYRPAVYADNPREVRGKFVEADPAAPGDIEDAGGITLHRPDVRPDDVRNEDEIPGLPSVAVDDRRLPVEQAGDELRDHSRVLGVWVLPGTEDVKVPQKDRPKTIEVGEDLPVVLAREFRDRIGGERSRRHCLAFGEGRVVAVDRRGGSRHNRRNAALLCGPEGIEGSGHVHPVRLQRVCHGSGNRSDGRLVKDAVRPGTGVDEQVEVGDAPLDEGHPGVACEVLDILMPPGGEIVDDHDLVVVARQPLREVGPDEPRPACDDVTHADDLGAPVI